MDSIGRWEQQCHVNLGVVAQAACTRCSSSTHFLCQGSQTQYGEQLQRLRRLLYEADRLVLAGFTGTPILSEPRQWLVLRSKWIAELKHIPSFKSNILALCFFFQNGKWAVGPSWTNSTAKFRNPTKADSCLTSSRELKHPPEMKETTEVGKDSDRIDTTWIDMIWLDHAFHVWIILTFCLEAWKDGVAHDGGEVGYNYAVRIS